MTLKLVAEVNVRYFCVLSCQRSDTERERFLWQFFSPEAIFKIKFPHGECSATVLAGYHKVEGGT